MRRTTTVIEKKAETARTGSWVGSSDSMLPFGVAPYIKGKEDIEVMLRQPDILSEQQPIELSGYGIESALSRAMVIGDELAENGAPRNYEWLARAHPPIISFPADL